MKGVTKAGTPRQRTVAIDRAKFLSIRGTIHFFDETKTGYDTKRIAKIAGVSRETVNAVRRAGTWPKFVAAKQARAVKRRAEAKVTIKPGTTWSIKSASAEALLEVRVNHLYRVQRKLNRRLAWTETLLCIAAIAWGIIALHVLGVIR